VKNCVYFDVWTFLLFGFVLSKVLSVKGGLQLPIHTLCSGVFILALCTDGDPSGD
jgi:hypothetical protein